MIHCYPFDISWLFQNPAFWNFPFLLGLEIAGFNCLYMYFNLLTIFKNIILLVMLILLLSILFIGKVILFLHVEFF